MSRQNYWHPDHDSVLTMKGQEMAHLVFVGKKYFDSSQFWIHSLTMHLGQRQAPKLYFSLIPAKINLELLFNLAKEKSMFLTPKLIIPLPDNESLEFYISSSEFQLGASEGFVFGIFLYSFPVDLINSDGSIELPKDYFIKKKDSSLLLSSQYQIEDI